MDELDPHQRVAFAILPKVGGVLSIIGSVMILRDIGLKFFNGQRTLPLITKVMTLITVANLFLGCDHFLSTWMVPTDSGAFMASGNITTCNMQGFTSTLMIFIVETTYTLLSILYFLTVARRDWTTQKTESVKVMFSFLGLPIIFGLGFAITLLVTKQYNFTGVDSCGVASYPAGCHEFGVPCTRAPNAKYIREGFFAYIVCCMVFIIGFISILWFKVKKQDAHTAPDSFRYLGDKGGISNPVMSQALRYATVFVIPNTAFIIWSFVDTFEIKISHGLTIAVLYLYVIVWPLFGALVSLVYFRLRYLNERKCNPEASWKVIMGEVLTFPSPSTLSTSNNSLHDLTSQLLFKEESPTGSQTQNENAFSEATITDHNCLL